MAGKTALVTGAARGIGLATTLKFLNEGRRVAMVDIDGEELRKVSSGLKNVLAIETDVSNPDQVDLMASEIKAEFRTLDALINNAGVADFGPIKETTFARWRRVMETNLDGPFLVSQACIPFMAQPGAAIVNIASISGLRASTLRVAYGTSKAGLVHLTQQQAVEYGEIGIRANTVSPGPVDTKLALAVHTPAIRKAYHDAIPLNRYGIEQEIANAICFLCSDEASFITGQMISVDGGFQAAGVGLPALRT
ncbi:MAG: SDR family oxidoreductase [Proteobacteria bacterium]|nr:SDR family oxidoreductase [Pseudomonadota bacterium]